MLFLSFFEIPRTGVGVYLCDGERESWVPLDAFCDCCGLDTQEAKIVRATVESVCKKEELNILFKHSIMASISVDQKQTTPDFFSILWRLESVGLWLLDNKGQSRLSSAPELISFEGFDIRDIANTLFGSEEEE
ncbi:MAG: hypothetical protein UV70_C0007G0047 [Parcubacteria group bacterium GW2011_GWA2_43_13]|nr:MAG: hypothetical protein UV70_C0007G0047 [Parcubacteria group bacterium GW2011_GWA2_43_13]OGY69943.1 MAG: hypothetical protein A3B94_03155 [Candidatus Jacksonbacteria bacterium RIFCSPHIGHO2_02_FULL_43_10]OGY71033.1 MAG: hypothetical protein A2986_00985 [Candidatus Jacksonbacteria bacterium RIFCSPLOWO2_01_FULL_44_13]HAZ16898.1 hypothetical protein [Candidatus Jacksonbacteria bacterium]